MRCLRFMYIHTSDERSFPAIPLHLCPKESPNNSAFLDNHTSNPLHLITTPPSLPSPTTKRAFYLSGYLYTPSTPQTTRILLPTVSHQPLNLSSSQATFLCTTSPSSLPPSPLCLTVRDFGVHLYEFLSLKKRLPPGRTGFRYNQLHSLLQHLS